MEIGRKSISDEDFAKIWGELYQEFFNLTSSNQCDASIVYNAIYIICTSDSNLEEKLYWKIGDFFYNRCKIHKDRILQSEEYLSEYILQFQEYNRLVNSINTLGSFLNSCVKGRKLNDFGYLLWERMIIENLNDSFYENVFEYCGSKKLVILDSFEKIIPDNSQPLLYYKEKYEKIALNRIRRKYRVSEINNFDEFCINLRTVVQFESNSMKNSFLPASYDAVFSALEECFLGIKYYEIFFNLIEYINFNNSSNFRKILSKMKRLNTDSNQLKLEVDQYQVCFVENMNDTEEGLKKNLFCYHKIPEEQYEALRNHFESDNNIQKILFLVQGIFNKRRNNIVISGDKVDKSNQNFSILHRNDSLSVFSNLLDCFGSLNATHCLLKKAYACYVSNMIKNNSDILESSVDNIIQFFDSLDIFDEQDFKLILLIIFRDYLQRAKPCYMKRLCDYTTSVYKETDEMKINDLKPFDSESSSLFKLAVSLVSDKREFLNMYQTTLRDRLLDRTAIPLKELRILRILEVPPEDKLFKMVGEMDCLNSNFKILNSLYWNIEPQFSNLPLPVELIRELNLKKSEIQTVYVEDKEKISEISNSKYDLVNLKFKMKCTGSENKIITLAHQYSTVQLIINSKSITFNIYQYVILCLLMQESVTLNEIMPRLNNIPENIVKKILNSLILGRFINLNNDIYSIDCSRIESGDYSKIQFASEPEADICIESYLQTIGAKILKFKKEMNTSALITEIKLYSKVEVTNNIIDLAIKKLIEKGIAELKGEILEFIP